ncbi:unnamed protein product [Coccothraustes coccothraustes]
MALRAPTEMRTHPRGAAPGEHPALSPGRSVPLSGRCAPLRTRAVCLSGVCAHSGGRCGGNAGSARLAAPRSPAAAAARSPPVPTRGICRLRALSEPLL